MNALLRRVAPRLRPLSPRRSAIVAVLDIGTSKVTCLIGRLKPVAEDEAMAGRSHAVEVLGLGYTRAEGLKAGMIADLAPAEEAILNAVDMAERAAGMEIAAVLVAFGGGRLGSESFTASVRLNGPRVEEGDIGRVLDAASQHSVRGGRAVLHSLPVAYKLDQTSGIRDPRGMLGKALSVDLHVITTELAALKNLMLCVERCHLSIEGVIAAPYAAGLAALTGDEAELGATVVDFGAGTTTAAVFAGGHCLHVDGIAIGSHHITMDLARGLAIRIPEAERLKTLHAAVLASASDEHKMITTPVIEGTGREAPNATSLGQIVRMASPRAEEILEMLRERLRAADMLGPASRRLVLTGAAAELTGLVELAGRMFKTTARLGRPLGVMGLGDEARTPAFAVASGLLVYPQFAGHEHFEPRRRLSRDGNYLIRVGRWLQESF
ncbi:MAG TPA: cell division protein FtsA [Xanthobacteraceae bacterium]|nr:cell division protein FtsA [Xanthobacteraceae bacterium]